LYGALILIKLLFPFLNRVTVLYAPRAVVDKDGRSQQNGGDDGMDTSRETFLAVNTSRNGFCELVQRFTELYFD